MYLNTERNAFDLKKFACRKTKSVSVLLKGRYRLLFLVIFIRVLIEVCHGSLLSLFFCLRHYKVKFDINPDYIFQTPPKISLS